MLLFVCAQQLFGVAGHILANSCLSTALWNPLYVQRLGLLGLAATLAVACAGPWSNTSALALMTVGAGLSRGLLYAARLWMEIHLEDRVRRQRYLTAAEAVNTGAKIVAPLVAAGMLWWYPQDVRGVFVWVGILALLVLSIPSERRFEAPLCRPLVLRAQLRYFSWSGSTPYFVAEGAAHALRLVLFVSGALAVVGSVKAFSLLDAAAYAAPAGLPTLKKLLWVMGLAWMCLLVAQWWPVFLPAFVALYATALPLTLAQKAGLTLNSLEQEGGAKEAAVLGRSLVLVAARSAILLFFWLVHLFGLSTSQMLVAMIGAGLLLLPVEYWTAKHCLVTSPPKAQTPTSTS